LGLASLKDLRVLVVNPGSSTLKLGLLGRGGPLEAERVLATRDGAFEEGGLDAFVGSAGQVDAAGHRVVHGGSRFTGPALIDDGVVAYLETLVELAPLHQGAALAAIAGLRRLLPGIPHVACFDTAFHARMPAAARTYAIPAAWRERFGVRRFGFHGLSHAYAARRAAQLLREPAGRLRVVTCHLGSGASLAAVRGGRSVDTTMGFTPLEGLVMATRSGSVDPGLLLWLQQRRGLPAAEVLDSLEHGSGLRGLAGSADMRQVLSAATAGDPASVLALDVYVHRLRAAIAAMAAALGGLDALVFTGGVGENAPEVRARAASGLRFLGVSVDGRRNRAARGDADVSRRGAAARTLVVRAREDLEIVRQVWRLLGGRGRGDTKGGAHS